MFWFFSCAHKRTTFPRTPLHDSKLPPSERRGAYVVCHDCGREFEYSWQDMKIGAEIPMVPKMEVARKCSANS